ncbi:potassium transporter TrkG [Georgenia sp. EYE_87]|uniref:TrkH family potassium uptake protein n=1 Tax=Georgenia sp. EYE_87 TaxID=2853448 RepID=UPI0027E24C7D|nr:potassium transporter TrkG [Georgenia sp. EYE_87]
MTDTHRAQAPLHPAARPSATPERAVVGRAHLLGRLVSGRPGRPDPTNQRRRREINRRRPVQVVILGFVLAIAVGTALLLLPVAAATGDHASFVEAFFTAVSAICVTGLVVVDTPTYWSTFGQVVILVLIQIGGFGVMTMASVLGLMLSRRLDLQSKFVAATATRTVSLGDVTSVLLGVLRTTLIVEATTALLLTLRWSLGYDVPLGDAAWLGVFHAVSAFNNAGFALFGDSLMGYAADPWISLPVAAALIVGGLGFPVLLELYRQHRKPARWSLQTKITLLMTAVLLPVGALFVLVAEWGNGGTLGPLSPPAKLLAALFQSATARTAGFNTVDIAEMNTGTWLGMDVLMFIGGGSAGTAGGIKVTTFTVLAFAIWSELRGNRDVSAYRWRISSVTLRQALTVALLSVALVVASTITIAMTSPFTLDQILFEVVSAFATVGLSTGITADLAVPYQFLLTALMFIGRLGPITLGTALAMRTREQAFRYPETTTTIG